MNEKELTKIMIEAAHVEIHDVNCEHFLAVANVIIGYLEIRSWTIGPSKFPNCKYSVQPPRIRKFNYSYISDKDLYGVLQEKIISAYERWLNDGRS